MIFGQTEIFPRIYALLPYWSLILEEHYYIFWGVLFCTFAYSKLKINLASIGFFIGLLGLGLLMRKVGVNYWTLPGRFDGFLAGSIAGVIIFMPKKVEISQKWAGGLIGFGWFLSVVALARLLWSGYNSYYNHTKFLEGIWIDVTCYTIISVVLVLWMVKIDIRGRRVGRLQSGFAFLGLISYEIYLVHFPIVTLLKKAYNFNFHNGALVLFPLTLLISSVVGYYMHKILTAPALKKREQIHSFLAGLAARFRPQPAELGTTGISIDEPATVQLSSATRKLG